MKFWLIATSLLVFALPLRAENEFLPSLTPQEAADAGLGKLSPEERARLEILVQRYKSGELTSLRTQAEAKINQTQLEASKQIAAAEQKAQEAELKAKEAATKARAEAQAQSTVASNADGKKQPSWFTALITLKHAGEKPAKEQPLESRLVGDFQGWDGHTVFTLENGTRWIQQNKTDRYAYSPVLHSPKVKILPAMLTGFWLEIEGVNLNVRVSPLQLPD